jgi:hypothetical protein
MTQFVITPETHKVIAEKLEAVLDRKLTGMEDAIVDYVVTQIRFSLVEVK